MCDQPEGMASYTSAEQRECHQTHSTHFHAATHAIAENDSGSTYETVNEFVTPTESMFGDFSQVTDAGAEADQTTHDQGTKSNQSSPSLETSTVPSQLQHHESTIPDPCTPSRTRPSLREKVTDLFKRRGSPSEGHNFPTASPKNSHRSSTTSTSDKEGRKSSSSSGESSANCPVSLEQTGSPAINNKPRITIQDSPEAGDHVQRRRPRATTSFRDTVTNLFGSEPPKLQRCYTSNLNTAGTGTKSRRMSMVVPADCFDVPVKQLSNEFRTWPPNFSILGWSTTKIGKGTTANVHKRHKKRSGRAYAVKEFRPMDPSEDAAYYERKIKSEAAIAMSVEHPNIVRTSMLCTDHGKWFLVMEHCEGGDLFNLIQQKYLDKAHHAADRFCIFKQIIQAIDFIHSHGIAHRDIKPDNILIDANSHIKITDFGSSEVFRGQHPAMRSTNGMSGTDMGEIRLCEVGICGSVPYLPPEVLQKKNRYDPRLVDVWGVATVMLCMTFGGYLWERAELGNSKFYDSLVTGWTKWYKQYPEQDNPKTDLNSYPHVKIFDDEIRPPVLRRLLLNMLNPDPVKRYSISDVANSHYIKNIECCAVYVPPIDPLNPLPRKACPVYRTHDHFPNPRDKIERRPTR